MLLDKNIIQHSKHALTTFKKKINMQRGRFGHRPRNDPRYYNGIYPFIQTGNIVKASESNEKIEYSQTLNELGLFTSRLFNEKVLVITIAANIGYTAILDYPACFPDSLIALTLKDNDLTLEYLNIYIRIIRQYIEKLAPQAAQKNINLKQLGKLPIIVPNKDIQKEIVSIMESAYSKKIQLENEAQVLLKSIDTYLLQELGITIPSEEKNTLESRMFYVNLKDILKSRFDSFYYQKKYDKYEKSILSGKYPINKLEMYIKNISYGASVDNCYDKTGIPMLRIRDIKPNAIDSQEIVYLPVEMEEELHHSRVRVGDILITRSGTIGVCSIVDKFHDGFAFGSFMIKISLKNIVPEYVSYIINSYIGKKYFERNKIGAVQGNITIPIIKSLLFPVPQMEKQKEIVQKIKDIYLEIKRLDEEAQETIKLAKSKVEKILLYSDSL